MTRDIIIFYDQKEALDFYIKALSNGIFVDWKGMDMVKSEWYYSIIVDKEKTFNQKEFK